MIAVNNTDQDILLHKAYREINSLQKRINDLKEDAREKEFLIKKLNNNFIKSKEKYVIQTNKTKIKSEMILFKLSQS